MLASSREEIKEYLRQDVYAKEGVWDVENVSCPPSPLTVLRCPFYPLPASRYAMGCG